MTTLATDGVTLASDGQTTCGNVQENLDTRKVFRLSDGTVLGLAGDLAVARRFLEWADDGFDPTDKPELGECFEAVRINGASTVLVYDAHCYPLTMPVPYCAGSGKLLALGAMLAGKSPREAVKIACERDIYSGGTIRCLKVRK